MSVERREMVDRLRLLSGANPRPGSKHLPESAPRRVIRIDIGAMPLGEAEDVVGAFRTMAGVSLLERAPADPVARAELRMNDAAKRGGFDGMVKATALRIKATKSPAKRAGLVSALDAYISQLIRLRDSAKR